MIFTDYSDYLVGFLTISWWTVVHCVTCSLPSVCSYCQLHRHWKDLSSPVQTRGRYVLLTRHYYQIYSYLFKRCWDQMVHRCVAKSEIHSMLKFYHSYACDSHFEGRRITTKVLQSGFYSPTIVCNAYRFCLACECCQRTNALSHHNVMGLYYWDIWCEGH